MTIEITAPTVDGRSRRKQRSRAAILAACRSQMRNGCLRPTAAALAVEANCAVRTVFQHWDNISKVHLDAAQDSDTEHSILHRIDPVLCELPIATRIKLVAALLAPRTEGVRDA